MQASYKNRLLYCRKRQKITASQQRQHHNLNAVKTIISVKIFFEIPKEVFHGM